MAWSIIPGDQIMESHFDTWQQVNKKYNCNHPLLDNKFVYPLFRYFSDNNVCLAIYSEKGEARDSVFIKKESTGVWQIFKPGQAQLGIGIFSGKNDPVYLRGVLDSLMDTLPGMVFMIGIIDQDPDYSALECIRDASNVEIIGDANTTNINNSGNFDVYWGERCKKIRHTIRGAKRKLDNDGIAYSIVEISEQSEMKDALKAYGALEDAGWKGKIGTAINIGNIQGKFYLELMEQFAEEGGARIYQLLFDDKIVASLITIIQNGMMVVLKTTYDESMSKYTPGRLIDYLMIEKVFAEPVIKTIENYTNASAADAKWCTGVRTIYHMNYYRYAVMRRFVSWGRAIKNNYFSSK